MKENFEDKEIERKLWHGTAVHQTSYGFMPLVSICAKGFNRNYSGSATGIYSIFYQLEFPVTNTKALSFYHKLV